MKGVPTKDFIAALTSSAGGNGAVPVSGDVLGDMESSDWQVRWNAAESQFEISRSAAPQHAAETNPFGTEVTNHG